MTTKNKIFLVGVAIFTLLVIVLLVLGITTHDEPTFKSENRWGSMPLVIECSGYVPERTEDCETAFSAAEDLNQRLGFDAFVWADDGPPDIIITIGVPHEPGFVDQGGHYELSGSGSTWDECRVLTSNTGTDELLSYTVRHELGHCLGLAHDDFDLSMMFPEQRSRDLADAPRLTDDDRAAIRDRYMP